MKHIVLFAVAVTLTGCVTDPVRTKVAGAYDNGLKSAEGFVCNDASVGSIIRRYGVSADRAQVWKDFCFGQDAIDIAIEK